MRYVSSCSVNRRVFNADLKLLMGPKGSPVMSSRPLELQRRTIDDRTCCNGDMAWPADASWLTTGADNWKRQMYTCSSPPSTGEHDAGGTDILWLRAYTEHVDDVQPM